MDDRVVIRQLQEPFAARGEIGRGRLTSQTLEGGHDVQALDSEVELEGLSDPEVLELAAIEGRVLVTANRRDFESLLREWTGENRSRAGVILEPISVRSGHELEMDLFMFPTPIQAEKSVRPVFPYMLLVVDAGSGMVVGTDLLEPVPSLEAMWGLVPLAVTRQLAGLGFRPEQVTVGSELLSSLLQPLAESSRFELERAPFLPALHEAREALFEAFR